VSVYFDLVGEFNIDVGDDSCGVDLNFNSVSVDSVLGINIELSADGENVVSPVGDLDINFGV
jgi:hypothetical protein